MRTVKLLQYGVKILAIPHMAGGLRGRKYGRNAQWMRATGASITALKERIAFDHDGNAYFPTF